MSSVGKKVLTIIIAMFMLLILMGMIAFMAFLFPERSSYPGLSKGYLDTMVMTNSPVENDKGFNQLLLEGANEFALEYEESYGEKLEVGKITPKEIDNITEYRSIIKYAFDYGTDYIVTVGYNLLDSLLGVMDYTNYWYAPGGIMFDEEYKDKYFAVIDDATHSSGIARNVLSVRFESVQGGFLAGVSAALYSTSIESYIVSTFGGAQYGTVFDWMSGFEQGVNWFNYSVLGYDIHGEKVNSSASLYDSEFSNNYVVITNGKNTINYENEVSQDSANKWYTGSFNLGEGTQMASSQIDANSSVIFPVAGAQTLDAINMISSSTKSDYIKVMGVDSNASLAYPDFSDIILGSATKNIEVASSIMLWYGNKFISEYGQDISKLDEDTLDSTYYYLVSKTPDEYGWKEYDETYLENDLTTKTEEEVEEYIATTDMPIVNDSSIDYYSYGQNLNNGSMFVGNYNNGGVTFTTEGTTGSLDEAYNVLFGEGSIDELFAKAFEENEQLEIASNSFSDSYSTPVTGGYSETISIEDGVLKAPWLPDWSVYKKV